MAEILCESPVETRIPWRIPAFCLFLFCLTLGLLVGLRAKLFSSVSTTWLDSLENAALLAFVPAPVSAVLLVLWNIHKRDVFGRLRLTSVVYPDRLSIRFQGRNVDFPFDEQTDVSIGKARLTRTTTRTRLGSSFTGRKVNVRVEPRNRLGFWNPWESLVVVVGGLLIALGLQLFRLWIGPVVTPKLVGLGTETVGNIILIFTLLPPLILCSILLPLALGWYVGIRPRLGALLERRLRSSHLLEIYPSDPDGFYAALSTALQKYRNRVTPATSGSKP